MVLQNCLPNPSQVWNNLKWRACDHFWSEHLGLAPSTVKAYAKWGGSSCVGKGERHSAKTKANLQLFCNSQWSDIVLTGERQYISLQWERLFLSNQNLPLYCVWKRKVGQRKKQFSLSTVMLAQQNLEDSIYRNISLPKARRIRRLPECHYLIHWICGKLSGNLIRMPAHFWLLCKE